MVARFVLFMLQFRSIRLLFLGILLLCGIVCPLFGGEFGGENDSRRELILQTIQGSRRALLERQFEDGLFPADGYLTHQVGTTALATLALVKTAASHPDPAVERSVSALRRVDWASVPRTHELALGVMALIAVHRQEDFPLIEQITQRLIAAQRTDGGWSHRTDDQLGDMSISCFALIALRDAQRSGVSVPDDVWHSASREIRQLQRSDGGWYDFATVTDPSTDGPDAADGVAVSTLTGTLAGLCALSICGEGQEQESATARESRIEAMAAARAWLQRQNLDRTRVLTPASIASFHLLGLEMANRPRGFLFETEAKWHEIGVHSLLMTRNQLTERWPGTNDVISTSYAMLCLAARRGPVTIHRLSLSGMDDEPTPHDVWNLNELFLRRRGWPRTVTCREITLQQLPELNETSRILYLTTSEEMNISDSTAASLRQYLDHGGLIIASPQGNGDRFHRDLKRLVAQLYRPEEGELTPVPPEHPIYRMELTVDAADVPLESVDAGCRTTILYSPVDLSETWEKVPLQVGDNFNGASGISPGVRMGLNFLAYASDPDVPTFPRAYEQFDKSQTVPVADGEVEGRHLMQIGQLQVPGSVSPVPHAWERPIARVNVSMGPLVGSSPVLLDFESSAIFDSPLLIFHGAKRFVHSPSELEKLRQHLRNGGLLFADACCSSAEFDTSFRKMVMQLFPDRPLRPISLEHPLFSFDSSNSLKEVRMKTRQGVSDVESRREAAPESDGIVRNSPQITESFQEPKLEGVEIDGRLVIIYSRHDLSCALQKSAGRFCEGYQHDDAVRIAANVILYCFLQEDAPELN